MSEQPPETPKYEFEWQNPNAAPKFDLGRVFSRCFAMVKSEGRNMALLLLCLFGPFILLAGALPLFLWMAEASNFDFETLLEDDRLVRLFIIGGGLLFFIGVVFLFICAACAKAALCQMAYGAFKGTPISISQALRGSVRFILPMFGCYILVMVGVMCGFLLFIIPGIFLALGWIMALPILILEKRGVIESLKTSWQISKGSKRWILCLLLIFGVIGTVIYYVLSSVPFIAAAAMDSAVMNSSEMNGAFWILWALMIGQMVLMNLIAAIIAAIMNICWMVSAYIELRDLHPDMDARPAVDAPALS